MRPQLIRLWIFGFVALALLASAPHAVAIEHALPAATADAMAQAASPQAIAEYRRKLKEYQEARAAFEAGGRRLLERDLRKAARPQRQAARSPADRARRLCADPAAGLYRAEAAGQSGSRSPKRRGRRVSARPFPSSPISCKAAAEQFQFTPQRPASEVEFKRAYARYALGVGADARAGGAGLFVRDRRQRQLRHAVGIERVAARSARSRPRSATTSCSPPTASS